MVNRRSFRDLISRVPTASRHQTARQPWRVILVVFLALGIWPASGESPPDFAALLRHLDRATEAMTSVPMSATAVQSARSALAAVDSGWGPALAPMTDPPDWCRRAGLPAALVIEAFNRFNEAAEALENAESLDPGRVWQTDPATRAYVQRKLDLLAEGQRLLAGDRYHLFRWGGRDGDRPETVRRPWQRWTGPRYGYDRGRLRRREILDLAADGTLSRESELERFPWSLPNR